MQCKKLKPKKDAKYVQPMDFIVRHTQYAQLVIFHRVSQILETVLLFTAQKIKKKVKTYCLL